jgi:hypothetical protein
MFRITVTAVCVAGLVLLGATRILTAQSQPEIVRTWNVSWVDVSDPLGNHHTLPVLGWARSHPPEPRVRYAAPPQVSLVASLEEEFRTARLSSNGDALSRILSDDFVGTNQYGDTHTKVEMIEQSRALRIRSLVTDRATITSSGPTVIVTGEQTEVNSSGSDRLLFSRVYVQEDSSREWRLVTSTQFRKP